MAMDETLAGMTDFASDLESGKTLEECGRVTRVVMAQLVWTDATPTAPGVYLWRYDSMSPIDNWEIVEACLDNKFGIVRRRGSFSYAFPDGQFAGPISMPVEPKEERK